VVCFRRVAGIGAGVNRPMRGCAVLARVRICGPEKEEAPAAFAAGAS
jgi:hypothetical protein